MSSRGVRRALGLSRHRPHRHARSAGHGRAAPRDRARHAARLVPQRRPTRNTRRASAWARRPRPTTPPHRAGPAPPAPEGIDAARIDRGARRVPRHVSRRCRLPTPRRRSTACRPTSWPAATSPWSFARSRSRSATCRSARIDDGPGLAPRAQLGGLLRPIAGARARGAPRVRRASRDAPPGARRRVRRDRGGHARGRRGGRARREPMDHSASTGCCPTSRRSC